MGIATGDCIRITSRRGTVTAHAWVVNRPRPGLVFMTFHFAESLSNVLTNNVVDPISKIPEYKVCAVRVERVEAAPHNA
jgi:formate dehydrogenase major subunit